MAEKHRTVSRVIHILELVARQRNGVSLTQLCRDLDAPRSSVHGFVQGLVSEGYLMDARDGAGYVLGVGAHTLLASSSGSLIEILRPVTEVLHRELNETVTLAVPVGRDIAYVYAKQSSHPVTYSPQLHTRRHPWPTSTGKVFLAFGAVGSDWSRRDIEQELGPGALDELDTVRDQGYGLNVGESVTDVAAVAVGVAIDHRLVAALSIGGPRARIEPQLHTSAVRAHQELSRNGLSTIHP